MTDLRLAVRALGASRGFTLTAVVVLALGIGANAAMLTLADTLLVAPLPVPEPGRLVVLSSASPEDADLTYSFSYRAFLDLRAATPAFAGLAASSGLPLNVVAGGRSEQVRGEIVTGGYFSTLGLRAHLGRLLTPDDDTAGGNQVVVLDYAYWRELGGDPSIVGRQVLLNGSGFTIVGVTPPAFYGIDLRDRPALRVPMALAPRLRTDRSDRLTNARAWWLTLVARLRPGVGIEEAQAQATDAFRRSIDVLVESSSNREETRRRFAGIRVVLQAGERGVVGLQRVATRPVLLLTGATGLLLLIACANLANLLLARGFTRRRELAVKVALGGGRWRLVRQLMIENLLLALGGAALGMVAAVWMTDFILGFVPPGTALAGGIAPRPIVVLETMALAIGAAIVFGTAPAWWQTRVDPLAALKADAGPIAAVEGPLSLRSGLIVLQVALSVLLLAGAGLFIRTLANLRGVDMGFSADRILVAGVDPSLNGYTLARRRQLFADFLQRVERLPGVARAGVSTTSPVSGSWDINSIRVPGYTPRAGEDVNASWAVVSPGYLEALQIGLVAGRTLEWGDAEGRALAAVVNETMARQYFGGPAAAVGRRFFFDGENAPIEVVGVVRDGKYVDLREEPRRFAYISFLQVPFTAVTLHARTRGDAGAQAAPVRAQLRALDAAIPLFDVTTMARQVEVSLTFERILATLGTSFGLFALLLAAVGLYGLLAFTVARRTREIGVRMALGARPSDVGQLVFQRTGALLGAGVLLGLLGALGLERVTSSLLFGVRAADPPVLAAAVVVVVATTGLAAALPARRASRVDPLEALRDNG